MRDLSRVDRILRKLREYWQANPDYRLGQIIVNMTVRAVDVHADAGSRTIFFTEDDRIEAQLDTVLTEIQRRAGHIQGTTPAPTDDHKT